VLCTTKPESIGQYEIRGKFEEINLKQNMIGTFQSPGKKIYTTFPHFFSVFH